MTLNEAEQRIRDLAETEKEHYYASNAEYYLGLFQGLHDALAILKDVKRGENTQVT